MLQVLTVSLLGGAVIWSPHDRGFPFPFALPAVIPDARGALWLADRLPGGLAGLGWRAGGLAGGRTGVRAAECIYLRRKTHIERI